MFAQQGIYVIVKLLHKRSHMKKLGLLCLVLLLCLSAVGCGKKDDPTPSVDSSPSVSVTPSPSATVSPSPTSSALTVDDSEVSDQIKDSITNIFVLETFTVTKITESERNGNYEITWHVEVEGTPDAFMTDCQAVFEKMMTDTALTEKYNNAVIQFDKAYNVCLTITDSGPSTTKTLPNNYLEAYNNNEYLKENDVLAFLND